MMCMMHFDAGSQWRIGPCVDTYNRSAVHKCTGLSVMQDFYRPNLVYFGPRSRLSQTCTTVSPSPTNSRRTSSTLRSCISNHFSSCPPPPPARECIFHVKRSASASRSRLDFLIPVEEVVLAAVVLREILEMRSYALCMGSEGLGVTSILSVLCRSWS